MDFRGLSRVVRTFFSWPFELSCLLSGVTFGLRFFLLELKYSDVVVGSAFGSSGFLCTYVSVFCVNGGNHSH